MIDNIRKEEFSFAYIHALCADAGIKLVLPRVDEDSIDAHFSISGKKIDSKFNTIKLEAQLKCGENILSFKSGTAPFVLKKKNYNDLAGKTHTPIVLIVLNVPEGLKSWCEVNQSDQYLKLRKLAYWHSLQGEEYIEQKSKTIYMREENLLTPESLIQLIKSLSPEELS